MQAETLELADLRRQQRRQACIFAAIASSLMCTTNSPLARMFAAVSFSRPSLSRLIDSITIGEGPRPTC